MYSKKKYNTFLNHIILLVLALSATHCLGRCEQASIEDTTKLNLVWEADTCPLTLPDGFDYFTPIGFTCHVPSEKATYFLHGAKTCWKFTQGEDRQLSCEKVVDFRADFFRYNSCSFFAGTKEKQALFFGEIYNDLGRGDDCLVVGQLESGTWVEKKTENLSKLFPDHAINDDRAITGCTVEKDGQYYGCILFFVSSWYVYPEKYELACLLFNPSTNSFEKITVDPAYSKSMAASYLQASIAVGPGKILLAKGNAGSGDTYDLISFEGNQLKCLRPITASAYTAQGANNIMDVYRPTWDTFSLSANASVPVQVPIFTIAAQGTRKFYFMNMFHQFQELAGLPPSASALESKNTLVIPFSDHVYVIGGITDSEGAQKPVAYRAHIAIAEPKKKSK
jgi:hypothetical protein